MSNAKIILTADDYGFCDSVDNGIITAAEKGYISAVAAFANGPDANERLDRLKKVQADIGKKGGILDVGAHFTITSGKPLSDNIKDPDYGFVEKNGFFRSFTEIKFPENKDKTFQKNRFEALQTELHTQLQVFKDLNLEITNLSSHHNSLTFEEKLFKQLILFSKDTQIPLRSHKIYPFKQEKKYQLQWRVRLRDNNFGHNVRDIRKFFKNIEDHVNNWRTKPEFQPFPAMPDGINGVNYGPALPTIYLEDIHDAKAHKKSRNTFQEIQDVKYNEIMEFCFHLCDPNAWQKSDLIHFREEIEKNTPNPNYYPGVAPGYFDCRRMEFLSLELLHQKIRNEPNSPKIVSWKSIK